MGDFQSSDRTTGKCTTFKINDKIILSGAWWSIYNSFSKKKIMDSMTTLLHTDICTYVYKRLYMDVLRRSEKCNNLCFIQNFLIFFFF